MKTCLIDAGIFIEKPELVEPLKALGELSIYEGIPLSTEEVVARAGDADIIAFGLMQFTNEMLDALPHLKILQFIGTGVWNFVDVEYAEAKSIKVLNIDGYGSNAVAEFAVTMGLSLNRHITKADRILKSGAWTIDNLKGMEISGSTVGVLGTGSIGCLVAKKYHALGAKIIASDIYENENLKKDLQVKYVSPYELFENADILSLHMKVTKENQKMIGKEFFRIMKPNALFVNVARAELVNNIDLYDALIAGKLSGAAVDVYENEPPSEVDKKLSCLENVIATPHIGYYTQEANDNSIIMTVSSILEVAT